jgi:hypothetical protein
MSIKSTLAKDPKNTPTDIALIFYSGGKSVLTSLDMINRHDLST